MSKLRVSSDGNKFHFNPRLHDHLALYSNISAVNPPAPTSIVHHLPFTGGEASAPEFEANGCP